MNFVSLLNAVWAIHRDDKKYMIGSDIALSAGIFNKVVRWDFSVINEGRDDLRRFLVEDVKLLLNEIQDAVQEDFKKGPIDYIRNAHYSRIMDSLKIFRPYIPTVEEFEAGPFNPWCFEPIGCEKYLSYGMMEVIEHEPDPRIKKIQSELITQYYPNRRS